jgi:hypothetical protein
MDSLLFPNLKIIYNRGWVNVNLIVKLSGLICFRGREENSKKKGGISFPQTPRLLRMNGGLSDLLYGLSGSRLLVFRPLDD